jgi:valyl-tRNA synthetase
VASEVELRFEAFRFDEACNRLYHFFWGDLCDWYIELAKVALSGEAPRPRVGEVLLTVLDRSLRLLHPVMPFLTEELWQRLPGHQAIHPQTICLAPYPGREERWENVEVEEGMEILMQVVTRVRGLRAELGLPPKARLDLFLDPEPAAASADGPAAPLSPSALPSPPVGSFLAEQEPLIRFLCRVESTTFGPAPPGARRDLVAGVEVAVVVGGDGLGEQKRERLARELDRLAGEIARAEERLADAQFLAKAPAAVVAGRRAGLAELRERRERLRASLGAT